MIGVLAPENTPVPNGFIGRNLPATLIAKGIYGQGYDMVKTYKEWGYIPNYELNGWNGELFFDSDPDPSKWSNLTPIRHI